MYRKNAMNDCLQQPFKAFCPSDMLLQIQVVEYLQE